MTYCNRLVFEMVMLSIVIKIFHVITLWKWNSSDQYNCFRPRQIINTISRHQTFVWLLNMKGKYQYRMNLIAEADRFCLIFRTLPRLTAKIIPPLALTDKSSSDGVVAPQSISYHRKSVILSMKLCRSATWHKDLFLQSAIPLVHICTGDQFCSVRKGWWFQDTKKLSITLFIGGVYM